MINQLMSQLMSPLMSQRRKMWLTTQTLLIKIREATPLQLLIEALEELSKLETMIGLGLQSL